MEERKGKKVIKGLIWIVKSLCFGIATLFLFNICGSFFNMNVPINIWTILIVSVLKLPGLASIIIFIMIT